jgi:DNA-binding NarL/FixJ family response regulator
MSRVGVLTVHHDEGARRAARAVVNASPDFEEVGAAGSAEEAIELAVTLRPELALVAAQMPGIDGHEASRRLVAAVPGMVVCVLDDAEVASLSRSSLQGLWDQRRSE